MFILTRVIISYPISTPFLTKVPSTTKRRRRKNDASIEIQLSFKNMNKNAHVHENIGDPIA